MDNKNSILKGAKEQLLGISVSDSKMMKNELNKINDRK